MKKVEAFESIDGSIFLTEEQAKKNDARILRDRAIGRVHELIKQREVGNTGWSIATFVVDNIDELVDTVKE